MLQQVNNHGTYVKINTFVIKVRVDAAAHVRSKQIPVIC